VVEEERVILAAISEGKRKIEGEKVMGRGWLPSPMRGEEIWGDRGGSHKEKNHPPEGAIFKGEREGGWGVHQVSEEKRGRKHL